jgi:hypothetical protein
VCLPLVFLPLMSLNNPRSFQIRIPCAHFSVSCCSNRQHSCDSLALARDCLPSVRLVEAGSALVFPDYFYCCYEQGNFFGVWCSCRSGSFVVRFLPHAAVPLIGDSLDLSDRWSPACIPRVHPCPVGHEPWSSQRVPSLHRHLVCRCPIEPE